MMKRLLVSAIFLMLLFTASAQQFGVYGNVMLSKKLASWYNPYFFRSSSFGIDYHWRNEHFLKQTLSLAYEKKGTDYNGPNSISHIRTDYVTLKYLFRIGNSNFDFQTGPYIGSPVAAISENAGQKEDFYLESLRRFDMGLSANVNQYLFALDKISFHLRAEVNYGITNISKGDDYITFRDFYNRNLTCGLGIVMRWNNK
jgi:hypothetical protein